jgi:adenylosuccinate synthase
MCFILTNCYGIIEVLYFEEGESMKKYKQTVINVFFAISITAFIYQNNKQQERIRSLELNLSNSWDVIEIGQIKAGISELKTDRDKSQIAINKNLDDINNLRENLKNNIEVNNKNFQVIKDAQIKKSKELADAIDNRTKFIKENREEINLANIRIATLYDYTGYSIRDYR